MRMWLLILLILMSFSSQASESFSYSGRLVANNGSPLPGPVDLTFDLVYTSQPSSSLCSQDIDNVTLINGVFHVRLDFTDCNLKHILANPPLNHTVGIRLTDRTNSLNKIYSVQTIHAVPYSIMSEMSKQLAQMSATDGQVLTWNDALKKWEPRNTAVTNNGTLTSITTGPGLTGGPITESGTIAIAPGGVTSLMIANDTIVNSHISSTAEIDQSKIKNLVTDLGNKETLIPAGASTQYLDGDKQWQDFNQSVRTTLLHGLNTGVAAPITDANTVLEALENLQAQIIANDTAFEGTGQWSKTGNKIYYNSDNVGIGASNPTDKLEVVGNISLTGELKLKDADTHFVKFKAPTNLASDVEYVLPGNQGGANQVLTSNGAGVLSWETPSLNSSGIVDGSIRNEDIADDAAIAQSKIAGLPAALSGIATSLSSLNTSNISEDPSHLYFTQERVLDTKLTGLNTTTKGSITSADSVLSAIGKIFANQANYVLKSGDSMSGTLDMGSQLITNLKDPEDPQHAATRKYVDDKASEVATQWEDAGFDIYYPNKVGIGVPIPVNKLDVAGDIGVTGKVKLNSATTSKYIELVAPSGISADQTYTFPLTTGTNGYVLTTNGSGQLSWSSVTAIADGTVTNSKLNLADGGIPQSKIAGLVSDLADKEGTINAGAAGTYYGWNKTWMDFASSVRGSALTGLSTADSSAVTAADSVLTAMGKIQGQINKQGQWKRNDPDIYFDTGKVGIGTGTPEGSLQVVTSAAQTSTPSDGIFLGKSTGNQYQIQITHTAGTPHLDFSRGTNADYDGRIEVSADDSISVGTHTDPTLLHLKSEKVGIGTAAPAEKLSVNGIIHTMTGGVKFPDGSIQTTASQNIQSPSGSSSTYAITDLRQLYGKPAGTYYVKWGDGSVKQNYWDGLWLIVWDEGLNANSHTANWSDPYVTYMDNFGGAGPGYGHGWSFIGTTSYPLGAPNTNTLIINNLPPHSEARYSLRWHFVDSTDSEPIALRIYDVFGDYDSYETFWSGIKAYNADGVFTALYNTKWNWVSTVYSYAPYATASIDGYAEIDTRSIPHFSPRFKVMHYTELNQGIEDEAMYYTHVKLRLR